ncbi:MAG: alpha/beta hydrolase [Pseudomonadota bacterium]
MNAPLTGSQSIESSVASNRDSGEPNREHQFAFAHDFAQLSDGNCCYRIDGAAGGPMVLLIHGATVLAWEFDRIVPYFVAAGICTLRFDLFGHGYSDRPAVPHSLALFRRQTLELLDYLKIQEPISILGHSLGAAIAAEVSLAQPQRVKRLILVAPLLDFFATAPAAKLLKTPLLGELLVKTYVLPMLVRRRRSRYRNIEGGRLIPLFLEQLSISGFESSLLSLFRNGALEDQSARYAALDSDSCPVLLVRGGDDTILPLSQFRHIASLVEGSDTLQVEGLSHAMLLTDPEAIASDLLIWLAEVSGTR